MHIMLVDRVELLLDNLPHVRRAYVALRLTLHRPILANELVEGVAEVEGVTKAGLVLEFSVSTVKEVVTDGLRCQESLKS